MPSRPCQLSHNKSSWESLNPMRWSQINHGGGSPHCRRCVPSYPSENMEYNISVCSVYSDIRKRIIDKHIILCSMAISGISLTDIMNVKNTFYQFVLDLGSFNSTNPSSPAIQNYQWFPFLLLFAIYLARNFYGKLYFHWQIQLFLDSILKNIREIFWNSHEISGFLLQGVRRELI